MNVGRITLFKMLLFILCCAVSRQASAGYSLGGMNPRAIRMENMLFQAQMRMTQLTQLQNQLTQLRINLAAATNDADRQNLQYQIQSLEADLAAVMRRRGTAGDLIARGLAGADMYEFLEDTHVDGTFDGFKKGLTIRAANAFGKVVGGRIEGAFEDVVGRPMDFFMNYLMDVWQDIIDIFFHNGKQAFEDKVLTEWFQLINITLKDVENMMKDGLKESLRGYGMAKRKFGGNFAGLLDEKEGAVPSADPDANAVAEEEQPLDLVWCDLISGYADQFERLYEEINHRIGYYDESSMEVFYANQIKKRLDSFKTILLESKSLTDLDSKLHSNKSLIPAVRLNIENLFKRLMVLVAPRTYSRVASSESSSSLFDRTKKSSSKYSVRSTGDEFPSAFSSGSGF